MANWIYKLPLKDIWNRSETKDGDMPIEELSKEVAKRLRNLKLPDDFNDEKDELADRFENEVEDVEEFDSVLSALYDLADTPLPTPKGQMQHKLMWIETF